MAQRFELSKSAVLAGLVHLFTASGVLVALFAMQAVFLEDARGALLWLLLALVIDGIDGPLARRFQVSEHMPQIDGVALDLIIDFLTYVFIPVMFVWQFELFPAAWQTFLFAGVLVSSLYLFVYRDMKGQDNYFNGFPSAWNLVLIIWFILDTGLVFNAASTVFLCVMTFVPIKSVHPVRVARFKTLNIGLVLIWITLSAILVALKGDPQIALTAVLTAIWGLTTLYFIGFSFWRTLKG